jgi:DNA-binding NtrC family response regulator
MSSSHGAMKSLSILVADDEENIRAFVEVCATAEGHQVLGVENAREAKEALAKQPYDLVITDILMPEGDGLDLITQLRKLQPSARIVAMSGGGRYMESDDCLKMARGLGANAVMMKPFNREALLSAVKEAMSPPVERGMW